jgi:hypothetical protein
LGFLHLAALSSVMSTGREDLQQSVVSLTEQRIRIATQLAHIAELERAGTDTVKPRQLLALMRETLILMEEHRDMILRRVMKK